MKLDSFFTKGDSHKVCQDYAISGESEKYAYAIVCDGCSSSPKVDIGARLLAELFIANLNRLQPNLYGGNSWHEYLYQDLVDLMKPQMRQLVDLLGLDRASFDSTLLAAIYVKDRNKLLTFQWGDGRVTKKFKDGSTEQSFIVYSDNAPAYFSYSAWESRGIDYEKFFGKQQSNLHTVYTDQNIVDTETPNKIFNYQIADVDDLLFVHLSSDGIESFVDDRNNQSDVSEQFVAFKGFEGEFVQRRMTRLIQTTKKEGLSHYDDLGVAAMVFD